MDCVTNWTSSRTCEKGTKTCVVQHKILETESELDALLSLLVDWEFETKNVTFNRTSVETLKLILDQHRDYRNREGMEKSDGTN